MNKMEDHYFVIDFDSTFTQVEALDELARISLKKNTSKEKIIKQIKKITEDGMDGRISFSESLSKRIALLSANRPQIDQLVSYLRKKISTSFQRNKDFFKKNANRIIIISGGFRDFIVPVLKDYGLKAENVFANTFIYDQDGNIIGCDRKNELSKEGGKVKVLKKLKLKGKVYVIGDGYSDLQLKEAGLIDKFFGFTENIGREIILLHSDHVTPSFDEFLYVNKLPMAISYPKNRIKALLAGDIPSSCIDILKKEGYTLIPIKDFSDKELAHAGLLICDGKISIEKKYLEKAGHLKVIGILGNASGVLDLHTATEKGIVVFDDPKNNPRNTVFIPKRIIDFINKGSTYLSVNFPNIELSRMDKAHRLIHIHRNVPGIMAQINAVFAKYKINIVGQYLKTNPQIGYVITDVENKYDKQILDDLKKINNTIKFRLLY